MNITSQNFKKNFDLIEKAINEAVFLTIDAEFTGLNVSKTLHAFDTPEERYTKLRDGALDFLLIQFGLCTFTCNDELQRYEHKAFNFYVFPKPFKRNGPDIRFMCQSSSIDFLLSQGFDFNKLFKDGISYLSPTDERKLKEQLEQKHHQQDDASSSQFDSSQLDESPIPIPDQHKSFIENICKKIEDFMEGSEETLALDPCNAFLRKLLFQTIKQRYSSGIYLESKSTPKKEWYIAITKANADKLKEMEKAKKDSELEELDDAIGFSKIIKSISSSGKLVVGHNMLLDVLHIIHKFCCPLPADLEDFKAITKCVFPRILDTKLMASTFPFKEKISKTMLCDLQKTLEKDPFWMPEVVVAEGCQGYNTRKEQLHEAGYDAYITGLCFISMARYLDKLKNLKPETLQPNWNLIEPFINKLHVMLVHDIPYMNLAGDDLKPNRDHVFHVRFPKDWKTSDLMQLFGPFGHVFVAWVDDTSAFVALERKDQAALVMRTLTQSDIYHVQSYKEYALLQQKPNPYDVMHQDDQEVRGHDGSAKRQLVDSKTKTKRARQQKQHDHPRKLNKCKPVMTTQGKKVIFKDEEDSDGTDESKEDEDGGGGGGDADHTQKKVDHPSLMDKDGDDNDDDTDAESDGDSSDMVSEESVGSDDVTVRKKPCKRKLSKEKQPNLKREGLFDVPSHW